MMDRAAILAALNACDGNVTAAARVLNVYPETLRYRVKILGIARPKVAVIPERHPPTAALMVELEKLRTHARALTHAYLPCPYRATHLRALEVRQRAILAQLRSALGNISPPNSGLPVASRGGLRPVD